MTVSHLFEASKPRAAPSPAEEALQKGLGSRKDPKGFSLPGATYIVHTDRSEKGRCFKQKPAVEGGSLGAVLMASTWSAKLSQRISATFFQDSRSCRHQDRSHDLSPAPWMQPPRKLHAGELNVLQTRSGKDRERQRKRRKTGKREIPRVFAGPLQVDISPKGLSSPASASAPLLALGQVATRDEGFAGIIKLCRSSGLEEFPLS